MKEKVLFWLTIVIFLTGIIFLSQALAAEFHVTNATEFQNALNTAAANGEDDTIYLAAGTYQGNFTHTSEDGKSLTVRGEPGTTSGNVVLDGNNSGKVINLLGSPGGGMVGIEGLTIQRGGQSGLFVEFADRSIEIILNKVIIQNNSDEYRGGGIRLRPFKNATIKIEIWDSIIRYNQSPGELDGRQGRGGGIWVHPYAGNSTVDLLIVNSLIYKNQANWSGGGIDVSASEVGNNNIVRTKIVNSSIVDNSLKNPDTGWGPGGGVNVVAFSGNGAIASLDLYNSIVYGNTSTGGDAQDLTIVQRTPGVATVNAYYSNIGNIFLNTWTGATAAYNTFHVINVDPLFVDPTNDDYHLSANSPCIDAGTRSIPSPPGLPAVDFEGNPRIIGPAPDIGAYEREYLSINPFEGTTGTEIYVSGSGFGAKKGKVLIGNATLTILEWTDGLIRCQLTKALPPGTYDVTIRPMTRGASAIVLENAFTVKAPEIDSVEPTIGSSEDKININGFFFGKNKGKVTLGRKSCKVLSWTMGPATGESEIEFVVPKGLNPGTYELKVTTTGVGSDIVNFNVE